MGFPPPLLRKNAIFEVFERLTLTFLGGFLDRTSWNIRWQLNQRDCELLHIYFKIIHQSLTKYPITLGLERSLTWNFQNQTLMEEGCYWWLADFLMPLSVCHRTYKLVASTNIKEIQESPFWKFSVFCGNIFNQRHLWVRIDILDDWSSSGEDIQVSDIIY